MKLVPLVLFLLLCMTTQLVTAFPQLLSRGGDEIDWGTLAQGSWDLITGVVSAGVGALGSAWNAGANLFQSPQSTDKATIQQDPEAFTTEKDSPATEQDTNSLEQPNNLDLPPTPVLDPPATPSADINLLVTGETDLNDPCYPSNLNDPECDGRPLDRVILTSICEHIASNQIQITEAIKSRNLFIESTLTDIDTLNKGNGYPGGSGVRKSQSNSYDVLFFLVPLTDKQVDDVNRLDGVYAVEFSQKFVNSNYRESDPDLQENSPTPIKIDRRNEVDTPIFNPSIDIETQPNVYPDLGFISTPFKKKTALAYDYESQAGERGVAWVVNSGVERHPDFDIEEYHFALGAKKREVDELGFGTCYASKVVGHYGVAKKGHLRVMKIGDGVESIADGLDKIMDSVKNMDEGFTVIALDQNWAALGGKSTQLVEDFITVLENDYHVPFVVDTGNEWDVEKHSKTDELNVITLPALWSFTHPLIAVGAVSPIDGKSYPWSRGGFYKTISAPGKVMCTNPFKPGSFQGTQGGDLAAAQVLGLLIYLLSSVQYGDKLRGDALGVPRAIRTLILNLGYKREGSEDVSIWNGLDSTLKQFWR